MLKVVLIGKPRPRSGYVGGPAKFTDAVHQELLKLTSIELYHPRQSSHAVRRVSQAVEIWRTLRRVRPAVVHVTSLGLDLLIVAAWKVITKTKIVGTLHGLHRVSPGLRRRHSRIGRVVTGWLEWLMFSIADTAVFPSEMFMTAACARYRVARGVVIPHGVDGMQIRPGRSTPPSGRLVVLANFHADKGAVDLPRLAEMLPEGLSLEWVGFDAADPRQAAIYESLDIAELLSARTRILPAIDGDEVPVVLGAAAVLLVPSEYETFSLVAMEALALGVPVVCGERVGVSDLIREGGMRRAVVAGRFADGYAAAVQEILADYERYSQASVALAKQHTWATTARQYLDVYRRIDIR